MSSADLKFTREFAKEFTDIQDTLLHIDPFKEGAYIAIKMGREHTTKRVRIPIALRAPATVTPPCPGEAERRALSRGPGSNN
jgi:hypothetical protein